MKLLEVLRECSQEMRRTFFQVYQTAEGATPFGKGAGGDTTRRIDRVTEEAAISVLQQHEVPCTFMSEETGLRVLGDQPSEYYLVVDPVDGTTNALRGIPFIATAIAVSRTPYLKDVETALVHDFLHDVTYTAQQHEGAFRNGEPISPSQTHTLKDAVVGVDLNTPKLRGVVTRLHHALAKTGHLRHLGANALEICYVADGTFDAFIDIRGKLRIMDFAASYLVVKEAGGIITTHEGKELNASLTTIQGITCIVAANRRLFQDLHTYLQRARTS